MTEEFTPPAEWLARITAGIEASITTKRELLAGPVPAQLAQMVQDAVTTLERGGRLFFAGNGGSCTDAMHLATEFVVRFRHNREPLAAIALGTSQANLTATGNDFDFAQIFVRELKALSRSGDLLIALSTSGNSRNILFCVEEARKRGLKVYGLTGVSGGKLAGLCPTLKMPATETARIQEAHITLGHLFCELVEDYFSARPAPVASAT